MNSFGMKQMVENATRKNQVSCTLIDHIYTTHPHIFKCVDVLEDVIADYMSPLATINIKAIKKTSRMLRTYRCFRHYNPTNFNAELKVLLENNIDNSNTNALCKSISSTLSQPFWTNMLLY